MAELKVNVPLAKMEDEHSDDNEFNDFKTASTTIRTNPTSNSHFLDNHDVENNNPDSLAAPIVNGKSHSGSSEEESNFNETFSGSLEDLVNCFDDNISKCFRNYQTDTEQIAPVQVRTQEEIMNECQIWWTLTGNFGNILPIDWSKSYARKLHLPALGINPDEPLPKPIEPQLSESEDDELTAALDLHSLIVSSISPHDEMPPAQTADQVIQEIDEIMQGSTTASSEMTTTGSDVTMESDSSSSPIKAFSLSLGYSELEAKVREAAVLASSEEKLRNLPCNKLATLQTELESLIQVYNETLVQELALRDELEYEKELKNSFISLLLNVQNKRRSYLMDRKRKGANLSRPPINGQQPQFLTAVIPHDDDGRPLNVEQLQTLIKILTAVLEDNHNVPNLLTEYILNVVCPKSEPGHLPLAPN